MLRMRMTKFENATLYINGKNCGVIESSEVDIKTDPLPHSTFVLDDIEAYGEMTIISSPFFERMVKYRALKEACIEEAKRAVAEYKRKVGR